MCGGMEDIQSPTAEIRRGKKKKKARTNGRMKFWSALLQRATIKNQSVLAPVHCTVDVQNNVTGAKRSSQTAILVCALTHRQRLRSLCSRCMGGDRSFSLNDRISRCTSRLYSIQRYRYRPQRAKTRNLHSSRRSQFTYRLFTQTTQTTPNC